MQTTKALFGISIVAAALAMNAHAQVYQLSTPISGYFTLGVVDTNGPPGSAASLNLNFSTLTETIYLDPVAKTLRQVGAISFTPSATNLSFGETQDIAGQFPNPPQAVSGNLTVNLNVPGGNITFDTGILPVTLNTDIQAYSNFACLTNMIIPITGSYSLTTGGETYSGTFTYALSNECGSFGILYFPCTFLSLFTSNYPSSLVLSDLRSGLDANIPNVGQYGSFIRTSNPQAGNPVVLAGMVASNGFHIALVPGTSAGSQCLGDAPLPSETFIWNAPSSVIAILVTNGSAPSIVSQPQGLLTNATAKVSLSVAASGALPLTYQWMLNGTNISGATSCALTIPSVAQSDLGTYTVVVTNSFGTNTSAGAILSMYPFIAAPFGGAVAYWGENTALSVQAWGTGPLSYQWFDNGAAIPSATNSALSFTSIQLTNSGLYSVVVSSPLGSVTNAPAQVIVNPAGVSLGLYPGLTIQGVIGYSYIIQTTTNLSNSNSWVTLTNLVLAQPVQIWVDTNTDASLPANATRFYRVLPGQ